MDKRVKKWMSKKNLTTRQKNFARLMQEAGYGYTCMIRHLHYIESEGDSPAVGQALRSYKRLLEGTIHGRVGLEGIKRKPRHEDVHDCIEEDSEESSEEVSEDNESLTDTRWKVYSTEELIQGLITDMIDPIMLAQLVGIISE